MDHEVWIAIGLISVLLIFGILIFNRLVRRNNMVKEAWSNIDVQLKRRHVLIPNLLESVKQYMRHEKAVFVDVTKARNQCVQNEKKGPTQELFDNQNMLSSHLMRFWVLAENYPDIKANETFLEFQRELSETEDKIQLARRYYNGSVRDLNILVESFPSNLVATLFNIRVMAFFQIENPMERQAPNIDSD
jgi:LemA protein